MYRGVRVHAVRLLVPLQLLRIKMLALAVHGVHVAAQRPVLVGLVIIGIIRLQRSLYSQRLIELLQVNPFRKLLIGGFFLVEHQPLSGLYTVSRDT